MPRAEKPQILLFFLFHPFISHVEYFFIRSSLQSFLQLLSSCQILAWNFLYLCSTHLSSHNPSRRSYQKLDWIGNHKTYNWPESILSAFQDLSSGFGYFYLTVIETPSMATYYKIVHEENPRTSHFSHYVICAPGNIHPQIQVLEDKYRRKWTYYFIWKSKLNPVSPPTEAKRYLFICLYMLKVYYQISTIRF